MKEGWEYKKLGEVCEIVSGSTPKTNIPEFWGEGHYWITPAELNGSVYVDSTNRQITDAALVKTKLHLLPEGTVLLSSRAPIGKVAITTVPMYCNQGFKNCICSEVLFNKYLYYFLVSKNEYLNSLGVGATFKEISKSIVEKVSLPLPPLSQQQSIVAELDKINEIIDLKKAQLKDLDLLAQSIFYDMFGDPIENSKGWEVKKLGEVYKVSSSKRIMQENWKDEGVPFLKVSDIVSLIKGNRVIPQTFIDETLYEELIALGVVPKQDDILITSRGTLGLCYIVKPDDRFYFQDGMITWLSQSTGDVYHTFLTYLFANEHFLQQLTSTANKSTVAYISIGQLSKINVILPPLTLQQSFSSKIQAIEAQKSAIKQSLAEVETLLASRMDYWFN